MSIQSSWFAAAGASALCVAPALAAQGIPGTDIYLARLTAGGGRVAVGAPVDVTRRAGYDNQPAFTPDGAAILFTSIRADGQADIYRYDLASKQTSRVTATAESEYSPTPMPGGQRFSVVRVERDSTQRLWSFAMDGSDPQLALRSIKPVGYHAWLDPAHVAVYVLGSPATLQIVDTRTEHADTVARDIDRSLSRVADDTLSFVQRGGARSLSLVRGVLDRRTGAVTASPIAALPAGAAFVAWLPDHAAITGAGSKLYLLPPSGGGWQLAADLGAAGVANISRLAVSPRGDWIAIVGDDVR